MRAVAVATLDGRPVVVAGQDKAIQLWDLTTKQRIGEPLTGHTAWALWPPCTATRLPPSLTGGGRCGYGTSPHDGRSVRPWWSPTT
ncbi:hypothetical protein GCM10022225_64180 [Plantactinospora mayteni]|uniref:Uncharacterized protein n=1 Tax=Plantactinospora mayteni TaxID=566021 RepID=A0ABQ4F0E3_9ACTN|nr:hypothetical protein Pma05_69190 [Plantactinospora mayteni]